MKKSLIWIFLCVLLVQCEEEVPLDTLDPYIEKIVINEFFDNNGPFSIQVSSSKDAYKQPNPVVFDSGRVKISLSDKNGPIPLFYDNFKDMYYSSVQPVAGESYFITVTADGFPAVSATGKLPAALLQKSASFVEDGGTDMQGNTSDLLKLSFKDDPQTKDYYKVNFFYYSELVDKFNAFDFELSDVLTAVSTIKTRDGGFIFSDESFNGLQKNLSAVPPFGLVKANTKYKYLIRIERLSESYWKYLSTLEQYRGSLNGGNSGSNLFRGAVVVYSNVNNGLGIFAGSYTQSDTLR